MVVRDILVFKGLQVSDDDQALVLSYTREVGLTVRVALGRKREVRGTKEGSEREVRGTKEERRRKDNGKKGESTGGVSLIFSLLNAF